MWRVRVIDRGRDVLSLRAKDTLTGRVTEKKSKTAKRKEAEREAGEWQKELNENGKIENIKFQKAADRYEIEILSSRRKSTRDRFITARNAFSKLIGDPYVQAINESVMSDFSAKYARGRSPASLGAALRHLKSFLKWLARQRLITRMPHIEMPLGLDQAGGRALTVEEVERMLTVTPTVRKKDAPGWQRLIRGLLHSGLRLGEAVNLSWDDGAPCSIVEMETGRPLIRIEAKSQKGKRLTESPCTPDFVAVLADTPRAERHGFVFTGLRTRGVKKASLIIATIASKANIKGGSAHDLRRSFGTKWARVLSAQQLKVLMRHASIQTTLCFYAVGSDHGLSDQIWGQKGDRIGDKDRPVGQSDKAASDVSRATEAA